MPIRVIRAVCLILMIVSAQSDCFPNLQIAFKRVHKIYLDFNNNDMKAIVIVAIEFIPVIKEAICHLYKLPYSRLSKDPIPLRTR